jgi:hypothetical protein
MIVRDWRRRGRGVQRFLLNSFSITHASSTITIPKKWRGEIFLLRSGHYQTKVKVFTFLVGRLTHPHNIIQTP